jgi:phospholipid/cholesterol/gamma-HCH transport system permease protein
MQRFFTVQEEHDRIVLQLCGRWTVRFAKTFLSQLNDVSLPADKPVVINGHKLERLDTSGAWFLLSWCDRQSEAGSDITLEDFTETAGQVLDVVRQVDCPDCQEPVQQNAFIQFFIQVGRAAQLIRQDLFDFISFFGQLSATIWHVMLHPKRFRFRSMVFHMHHVGIKAIPIICLLAFLISMVLGYQGIAQLSRFNAQNFTIDLVAISILREMGVLLTSIMVAGRSGSAFTAQIGVMQINQEVDALRTIGLDPFEMLVLPRLFAIILVLPILTFIADIVGLLGALFIANTMLDMSYVQFIGRLETIVDVQRFMVGMVKAPVFGMLIGMTACLRGMQASGAAEDVGRLTTIAVVQSIFLIILADAIFSIIFTLLGI